MSSTVSIPSPSANAEGPVNQALWLTDQIWILRLRGRWRRGILGIYIMIGQEISEVSPGPWPNL